MGLHPHYQWPLGRDVELEAGKQVGIANIKGVAVPSIGTAKVKIKKPLDGTEWC